jgi:formylglycine-generating enzyme
MNVRIALVAAILVVTAATGIWFVSRTRGGDNYVQCASGFARRGARCLPAAGCPAPLTTTPRGCDAPLTRVRVPDTELLIGPSDWEAEGRVAPRTLRVRAFDIDAFEVTVGAFDANAKADLARAAAGMPRAAAEEFCHTQRGGRLPTDDEWIAAAAGGGGGGEKAWRYPWGNTGAVCRRAAWGLVTGPCAFGATEPDTVGTHPEGDTPSHVHDLAGNVAEWVTGAAMVSDGRRLAYARGGSYKTALATDLRSWAWLELDPSRGDPRVGFRCAYDPP